MGFKVANIPCRSKKTYLEGIEIYLSEIQAADDFLQVKLETTRISLNEDLFFITLLVKPATPIK